MVKLIVKLTGGYHFFSSDEQNILVKKKTKVNSSDAEPVLERIQVCLLIRCQKLMLRRNYLP